MDLEKILFYCQCMLTTLREEYKQFNRKRNQFVALSIDYAGLGINVVRADGFFHDGGLIAQNFITTTLCELCNHQGILHAEERVLIHFKENRNYFSRLLSDNLPHTLVFFTYYSPCEKCRNILEQELICFMKGNHPNVHIVICFVKPFIYKSERAIMSHIDERTYLNCPYSLKQFQDFKSLENRYPNVQIISIQDDKSSWTTEGSACRLNIMSKRGSRFPVWNLEYSKTSQFKQRYCWNRDRPQYSNLENKSMNTKSKLNDEGNKKRK